MPLQKTTDAAAVANGEPDHLIQGIFEPPNSFALAAIGRNKLVVCVCALALALIGTGYGLSRQRTYTAAATLQVGQVNPNSPGFYNYVQSSAALATAFSRAVNAEPVLAVVQEKLKLAPSTAVARLSAEPLPQSPAFRVVATGPTESAAIQLANVTANALITYEGQTNSANPEAASLLHEYNRASLELEHAVSKLAMLESSLRKHGSPRSSQLSALAPDLAARATAEAKLKAIDAAYTAAVTSQAPRSGLVSLLAGATSASSDANARIELYGFIGLLVGIVIGCLVAIVRERHRINGLLPKMEVEMQRSNQV